MHSNRNFGHSGYTVAPVGLGCSRLGSVLGASREEAEILLRAALESGINFFDTSNVYAQGESERLLGKVLAGRSDVVICTKVGKYLPLNKRLMLPFKSILKGLAGRSKALREGVRRSRSRGLPSNWEPGFIRKSVEQSLRRLGRDRVDVLMLHSPIHEVLLRGDAVGMLAQLKSEGKVGAVGVSVDDVATARAALADPRVEALQIPLHPGVSEYQDILTGAQARGVAIVAREVLGGPNVIGKQRLQGDFVGARLREAIDTAGVSLALLGTTKTAHLKEAISGAFIE